MNWISPEGWAAWAAWFSFGLGVPVAVIAIKTWLLAQRHDAILRGDEELVAGHLQKPDLVDLDHSKCVLWTHLVNRAQRRVVVSEVLVFGPRGDPIEVTWAGAIDSVGNPEAASGILAVDVQTPLYLRRNDGQSFADGTVVKIVHGFKGSPLVLKYSSVTWTDWVTS